MTILELSIYLHEFLDLSFGLDLFLSFSSFWCMCIYVQVSWQPPDPVMPLFILGLGFQAFAVTKNFYMGSQFSVLQRKPFTQWGISQSLFFFLLFVFSVLISMLFFLPQCSKLDRKLYIISFHVKYSHTKYLCFLWRGMKMDACFGLSPLEDYICAPWGADHGVMCSAGLGHAVTQCCFLMPLVPHPTLLEIHIW